MDGRVGGVIGRVGGRGDWIGGQVDGRMDEFFALFIFYINVITLCYV